MQLETVMNPHKSRPIPSYAAGYGEWEDPGPFAPIYSEELVRYREGETDVFPVRTVDGAAVPVNKDTCMRIQCGFVTQEEAGMDLLYACSRAGYVGAKAGCADPACLGYALEGECETIPAEPPERYTSPPGPDPVPIAKMFPPPPDIPVRRYMGNPMPSITGRDVSSYPAIGPEVSEPDCGIAGWIDRNRLLAVGVLAGGLLLLRGVR